MGLENCLKCCQIALVVKIMDTIIIFVSMERLIFLDWLAERNIGNQKEHLNVTAINLVFNSIRVISFLLITVLKGKNGSFYGKHGGFCLETQTFPDAINQSFDHDSILRPGQVYDHQVMYKFFF